jgi:hypothetical protein
LSEASTASGRVPVKSRKRLGDVAVAFSINHWIRVEALAILQGKPRTATEVAKEIGEEDVRKVWGHLRSLYNSGCIEIAGYKEERNYKKPLYRAIVLPVISDEVYLAMSLEERQDVSGVLIQGILTESLSSYRNGKMAGDEIPCLIWEPYNLDAQGQEEMHAHMISAWKRAQEIAADSLNRMEKSEEAGVTTIAAFIRFERGRPGRPDGGYQGVQKLVSGN